MGSAFSSIFPLLVVLALIGVVAWLLQRFCGQVIGRNALLTIHAAISVGRRERVVLVEVAGQWLVLGVTPGTISALHILPAPPPVGAQDLINANIPKGHALSQLWLDQLLSHKK